MLIVLCTALFFGCIALLIVFLKSRKNFIMMQSSYRNVFLASYIKDMNGIIIDVNKAFERIISQNRKTIIGKDVREFFSPEDFEEIKNSDEKILKTKEVTIYEKSFDFFNNEKHHFRLYKSPFVDEYGNISGFIVLMKDIDKEKKLEEEKEAFIATLTHDLKTPTNAQIRMIKLLINGAFGKLNDEQTSMLELTKSSCEYMFDLISTIVDTYRCDFKKMPISPEKFDIVDLVYSVIEETSVLFEEKIQKITVDFPSKMLEIEADRLQLKRVIFNLLSNSNIYGFEKSDIKVSLLIDGEDLVFRVENKGNPISKNDLSVVFDKCSQTAMSKKNKVSSGLGLYLSKSIIELHKGTVFAQSNKDGVFVFGFEIPLKFCYKKERAVS